MGKASTGAKAGLVSGLIYSAITAGLAYYSMLRFKEEILSKIEEGLPPDVPIPKEQIYQMALISAPIGAFLFSLVLSVIIGVIFGLVYEKLPGSRGVTKGIVVGIALWIVSLVLNIGNLYMPGLLFSLVTGLIASLVYGGLLGILYDKFITPRF